MHFQCVIWVKNAPFVTSLNYHQILILLPLTAMPEVYLTRKEHFNAAHRLHRADWSEDENERVFGRCANANWHGHNYTLLVTVKGTPNPDTGFIINLKDLALLMEHEVVVKLDHKNLNVDVPFMKGILPSTENLAIEIWKILEPLIQAQHAKLFSVRLFETENNSVEYRGE